MSAGATAALQDGMRVKKNIEACPSLRKFYKEESTLIFWYDSVEIASSSP
jgi:hypothetical protein